MKVVAVMDGAPTDGGGFYQALNAVLQMQRLCAGRHDFAVATTNLDSMPALAGLGIEPFHLPASPAERFAPYLHGSHIVGRALGRIPAVLNVERRLLAAGADLAYFVAPWQRIQVFSQLCYWMTVWDLAHLDHAEFPEVARAFHARERVLRHALGPASLVIADSTELGQRICQRYGIAPSHVISMPFAPAVSLGGPDCLARDDVLRHFALEPGYFFYPAQFWAHKNHIRILEALRLCAARGHELRVVFAGDQHGLGVRAHLESAVAAMGLQAQVKLVGFVEPRYMRGLYQGSRALVMPTYFGPTNLPPLEAWSLGVPVLYSRHLSEQAGDAALLVDPDDADDLAARMMALLDDRLCADLAARGTLRLREIDLQRNQAEQMLLDRLQRLQARLRCSAPRKKP